MNRFEIVCFRVTKLPWIWIFRAYNIENIGSDQPSQLTLSGAIRLYEAHGSLCIDNQSVMIPTTPTPVPPCPLHQSNQSIHCVRRRQLVLSSKPPTKRWIVSKQTKRIHYRCLPWLLQANLSGGVSGAPRPRRQLGRFAPDGSPLGVNGRLGMRAGTGLA